MTAIDLIKQHEGLRLQAYRCAAGRWTIGWGHTRGVTPGMRITDAEAEKLLGEDLADIGRRLDGLMKEQGVELGANQRAALVSFAFNVGLEALKGSTLWRRICENPCHPDIPREFSRWKYVGGKVMPGLVSRREQEAALYCS